MFRRKKIWLWFGIGFSSGYSMVHPFLMLVGRAMTTGEAPLGVLHYKSIGETILMAFSYGMLPWGLGVALLSGTIAALIVKVNQARMEKTKLKGVMELAGAACHEMNQPMQVILGYADIIGRELHRNDSLREALEDITAEIGRMDTILKKIRAITRYETYEYLSGVRIIDIHKASTHKHSPG